MISNYLSNISEDHLDVDDLCVPFAPATAKGDSPVNRLSNPRRLSADLKVKQTNSDISNSNQPRRSTGANDQSPAVDPTKQRNSNPKGKTFEGNSSHHDKDS